MREVQSALQKGRLAREIYNTMEMGEVVPVTPAHVVCVCVCVYIYIYIYVCVCVLDCDLCFDTITSPESLG